MTHTWRGRTGEWVDMCTHDGRGAEPGCSAHRHDAGGPSCAPGEAPRVLSTPLWALRRSLLGDHLVPASPTGAMYAMFTNRAGCHPVGHKRGFAPKSHG